MICLLTSFSFGHAVIGAMCGIILQQRFSGDKNSVFHGVEPSSGPGSPPIVSYGPCLQDLVSDAARVFDTSWHWKRAGELLEAPIKDLSQRPACTYLIGESGHAVLSGDGKWFPSSQAYIEHRLDSAVSRLPQEEKRAICDMIIAIAWAEEAGTSDSPDTLCESVMDYAARCSVELKKQTVPRALKAAFKKYGVFIPEMEEAGVVHRCSGCSAHPSPDVKLLSCPCKAVRYCSKLCQTTHWKSTHKLECPTASKKPSKSADTGGPAAGSRSVSGPAETNSRTSSKRKPSETAIAAAHKLLCSGKNDGRGPMPGSEAAEAWKECLRRFITASGLTLDDHAVETTRSALAEYERAEKAFFATYPNAPDWANGIEGSLSEPSAPASGGSAPSARSGGGTPSARSRGGAPSARSGGGAPSDPASGGGASSVRSEPWMDAYRTRTEDGSHHMGDLELVTWSCVDEYGQRFGWGGGGSICAVQVAKKSQSNIYS